MRENFNKQYTCDKGLIQRLLQINTKKTNSPESDQNFLQKRYTNGQQGNTNRNHNYIPLHNHHNGHNQEDTQ